MHFRLGEKEIWWRNTTKKDINVPKEQYSKDISIYINSFFCDLIELVV